MYKGHSSMITRLTCLLFWLLSVPSVIGQGKGGDALRLQADGLFTQEKFAEAMPLYAQLVSLNPSDHDLNYRLGTCIIHSGGDKEEAIGFLKYAVQNASTPPLAWYYYGRAYHLTYQFSAALEAYQHFRGMEDKKALSTHPVDALEKQCHNGQNLLNNLKEVSVQNKVEVPEGEFFRYYDLTGIGGRIVVTPEELMSSLDKKSNERSLIYLPEKGGRIYFSSYGKDGRTGRDIYTTSLLPDGKFDEPLKLAGYINTDQDESFAFLAQDGKTFYFASKGHNSMGGYDVFKSSYDAGLDVYGPPVNLDFAVNTPSDDIFYMVDAEGKEACFASARDSDQGMIHVYRVSTSQQPITITVLKGTFASELNAKDRDAHIVVEDATTHELVADVHSDINGAYVLSLPHNGRYKFSVEAGPSGKTHVGIVDIPRSENPRAYRQELTLVDQGGEKLVIRNYFDEPLPDDLIALALDEIKRRAKLDVGNVQPVAEVPAPEEPVADVITAAGFTGEVTKQSAVQTAQQDAQELATKSDQLDELSGAAFSKAVEALAEAERAAKEAQDNIAGANSAVDEATKNDAMVKAADARRRSREALLKARAAYHAGQDLGAQQDVVQQQRIAAERRSIDLAAAVKQQNDAAALPLLKELKARLDEKNRPDASVPPDEQARRNASARQQEAEKALTQANAKRSDEQQLIDQVNRLKRERDATKGSGRKQQLDKEIAEQTQYQAAMHDEVEQAFAKARALENETAVARAQASLTRHLTTSGARTNSTELDASQLASLEQKIAATDGTISSLPIDERFDAMIAANGKPVAEREDFDWELASTTSSDRSATNTTARDSSAEADRAQGRQTTIAQDAVAQQVRDANAPEVDISHDAPVVEQRTADANGGQDTRPNEGVLSDRTATAVTPQGDGNGAGTVTQALSGQQVADSAQVAAADQLPLTPEQVRNGDEPKVEAIPSPQETSFLKENELAETRQLRQAARTRPQRDSLDARISTLEQELAAARISGTETMAGTQDGSGKGNDAGTEPIASDTTSALVEALAFERSTPETDVIKGIFNGYESDKQRLAALEDREERGASLNGLELMLVDSISTQTAAQLAELEKHPEQAETILSRVDRLRMMKEAHLRDADEALASAQERPAVEIMEDPLLVSAQGAIPIPEPVDAEEVATRYVAVEEDPEYVYESKLEHRSTEVIEASAAMNRDVVSILDLEDRIDSMETVLEGMPEGKAYDKLRDKTDRLIDDRMILRAEIGQRTEFISREEWKAGQDSLVSVRAEVEKKGLAPSEPLMVMARQMEADAKERFDAALALRKRADRSEDIVMRDSLFRTAYADELHALQDLDRAITVNNYLLSEHFAKGDRPSYAELEAELFGVPQENLADRTTGGAGTDSSAANTGSPAVQVVDAGQVANAERVNALFTSPLASDPVNTSAIDLGTDPSILAQRAVQVGGGAQDLERRSVELGDSAVALRDLAATAKKRDRAGLEMEASRLQQMSDSLHGASLAQADSARIYEQQARDAEQALAFRNGLGRYYYLSAEEQALVLNDVDHSRYFQARVRSLEQEEQAAEAQHDAASTHQLANALSEESKSLLKVGPGGTVAPEAQAKAAELDQRAAQLDARADSLEILASRMSGAANLNVGQASALLEAMVPAKSSSIMALEQEARRTEPWLAEAHSLAGEGFFDFEGMMKDADRAAREGEGSIAQVPAVASPEVQQTTAPRETAVPDAPTGSPASNVSIPEGSAVRVTLPAAPAPVVERPVAPAFAAPAALTADIFEMRPPGERVAMAIVIDQPKPAGLVFSVQVGAFRNPIPADLFGDMLPVMGESAGPGLTRYTAGLFTAYATANNAKELVRDRGYKDAFVVAYRDGQRITLAEAMRGSDQPPVAANTQQHRPDLQPLASDTSSIARIEPTPVTIQRPSQVNNSAVTPDDQAVLANYPTSAQAIVDQFKPAPEAAAYYNDPKAAPARQVETVKGLFFTVQVGVYSKPVPLDKLFNITPLNSERTETGKIRYTTGVYLDMERARSRKDESVVLGVKDAFVTAYLNGKRIPMRDARALLAQYGPSILVDPSIGTR